MHRSPAVLIAATILGLVVAAFLVISANQPVTLLAHAVHDDALYMAQARTLAAGEWMGTYNDRALAKPPGFPLFLAALYELGLPYSIGVALFKVVAALVCAAGIWRLTRAMWIGVAAVPLLLFHPQVFSVFRILRESIYPSQVLLFLGIILLSFRSRWQVSGFLAAGVVFGWTWITREEGIWMIPGVIVLLLALSNGLRALPALAVAFGIGAVFLPLTVGALNQKIYGRWTVAEIGDSDFVAANSRLLSVTDGGQKSGVGVTKASREAIYAVSPTFATLRPIIEAPGYWQFGCDPRPQTCGEIANGWWHWALRWGAWQAGYHATPAAAAKFYRAVADEVGAACGDGRLHCIWRPVGQLPTILVSDLAKIPPYFGRLVERLFLFRIDFPLVMPSAGSQPEMDVMLAQLNRPYAFQAADYKPAFLAPVQAAPGSAIAIIDRLNPLYRGGALCADLGRARRVGLCHQAAGRVARLAHPWGRCGACAVRRVPPIPALARGRDKLCHRWVYVHWSGDAALCVASSSPGGRSCSPAHARSSWRTGP